jgi:SIR2-like protein
VSEIFGDRPHALAHALLAALPVRETVTTNYDRLFEAAAAGTGRPVCVLPGERPRGQQRWLLKLHGDVADSDSVVLTREEFLEYDIGRSALSGVVQALLLTRHVLFVGLSLLDDNLVRIAHRAGQVRPPGSGVVGTTLSLNRDPLRAELWSEALEDLAMASSSSDTATAARRLEVFLDRVGAGAAEPVGYLLDPAYAGMLSDAERELANRLRSVADVPSRTPAGEPVVELLGKLGLRC